ncbi:high mobility group box domain-containing protein [Gorgonomyces haynaldii]|nr:high mobility group box domain-containing protein [Gorgonomyces haynaldii]
MPKEDKPVRKAAEGSKKKPRAKKDPNAPKKGLSAFMIFSQENRPKIKEENPEASFGELGKLLGQKWKELDEEDKKPYQEKAEADKARYEKQMSEYTKKGKASDDAEEEAVEDDE